MKIKYNIRETIETEPPTRTECENREITIRYENLKIEQMVGTAELNAKSLLKKNIHNKIVSKERFISEYNKTLKRAFTEELKNLELCNER